MRQTFIFFAGLLAETELSCTPLSPLFLLAGVFTNGMPPLTAFAVNIENNFCLSKIIPALALCLFLLIHKVENDV